MFCTEESHRANHGMQLSVKDFLVLPIFGSFNSCLLFQSVNSYFKATILPPESRLPGLLCLQPQLQIIGPGTILIDYIRANT